jgi:aminopeptidase N
MENKATDQFHPDWRMWLQSEADRQRAMRQDSMHTTHPVVQPVRRAEQADQAFDDITYRKGQAVVRMIESYIGADAFRDGVRAYMKRHQFGNTVTDDLWRELSGAGKPIEGIAHDFTRQAGVPLVSVETAAGADGGTAVTVTQGRFAVDEAPQPAPVWRIPVSAAAVPSNSAPVMQLIESASPTSISVPGKPPIKVNVGQTSYFRTRYSEDALRGLADGFSSLNPADQLGLLYDVWALGEAGTSPVGNYLELARTILTKADPLVARQVVATMTGIDGLFAASPNLARFRAFARKMLLPPFLDLGWEAKPGETDNAAVLREDLITALGRLEEPSVLDEARRRFRGFVQEPASLPAAIRVPVLTVVARAADAATYEDLRALAVGAKDALEKEQLFVALASARDPALAARSLEIALGDEVPKSTGPAMLRRVAVQNPDLAWAFALAHLDTLRPRLDAMQRDAFVPGLVAEATNPALLAQLRAYIDQKVPEEARAQVERFHAGLQFRLRVIAEIVPEIDKWLAEKAGLP